ncbi:hypothetical protein [Thalassospira sp.]|uniref:hypothetical protein n=1 Tax=Thalassospira sp. TaxID=1912094 RepID=UPI000C386512|nr:hypothetical protein [Thalassospira sp.]MBC05709.1 hypothetical protein [Thalassospira sp.]|tara:strand:- start:537 stop:1187 length:651 start_codon:yes stop_codon:yes gene_type:complete
MSSELDKLFEPVNDDERERSFGLGRRSSGRGLSEFARAAIDTTAKQDDWLIGAGVDAGWLRGRMARYGYVKAAVNDNGLWQPDAAGKGVIVVPEIPVLSPSGVTLEQGDLVACDPRAPEKMYCRVGTYCPLINPDAPQWSAFHGFDLRVFANPVRYLAGYQMGCVVVNWGQVSAMDFIGPRKIICDTLEIGERIDRLFRAVRAPEIHIQQDAAEAA